MRFSKDFLTSFSARTESDMICSMILQGCNLKHARGLNPDEWDKEVCWEDVVFLRRVDR
jgi:hypothetical protein